jgi:hypothetical protein
MRVVYDAPTPYGLAGALMNMRVLVALCLACLGVVARAPTAHAAKPAIAVLGLEVVDEGGGIDEKSTKLAKELTDALRQRAKVGTGPFALAPGSDKDLLELKLLSGCDNEADDCMAQIGKDLNADRLLYGKVHKRQGGYQVSLKLLNVASKKNEKSTSDVIPAAQATGPELTRWGKVFYNRLTGATDQGNLVVRANVDRGIVYLDGAVKGNLVGGTARIAGLSEGAYRLAVEADGHVRYEARVTVTGGQDTTHQAELEVNALRGDAPTTSGGGGDGRDTEGTVSSEGRPGGGSRALFWTSLVLTAGSATAMTVTGLQVRGSLLDDKNDAIRDWQTRNPGDESLSGSDACSKAKQKTDAEDVVDACKAGENRALVTNVLVGTTVLGAVATVLFYYKGYVEPRSESSASASHGRRKRKPAVAIVPSVSPTEVGAGVRIDF